MQCTKLDIAASHKGQSRTLFSQPEDITLIQPEQESKGNCTGAHIV
jgi:hypothetical protein